MCENHLEIKELLSTIFIVFSFCFVHRFSFEKPKFTIYSSLSDFYCTETIRFESPESAFSSVFFCSMSVPLPFRWSPEKPPIFVLSDKVHFAAFGSTSRYYVS